jgi:hypothetical protein
VRVGSARADTVRGRMAGVPLSTLLQLMQHRTEDLLAPHPSGRTEGPAALPLGRTRQRLCVRARRRRRRGGAATCSPSTRSRSSSSVPSTTTSARSTRRSRACCSRSRPTSTSGPATPRWRSVPRPRWPFRQPRTAPLRPPKRAALRRHPSGPARRFGIPKRLRRRSRSPDRNGARGSPGGAVEPSGAQRSDRHVARGVGQRADPWRRGAPRTRRAGPRRGRRRGALDRGLGRGLGTRRPPRPRGRRARGPHRAPPAPDSTTVTLMRPPPTGAPAAATIGAPGGRTTMEPVARMLAVPPTPQRRPRRRRCDRPAPSQPSPPAPRTCASCADACLGEQDGRVVDAVHPPEPRLRRRLRGDGQPALPPNRDRRRRRPQPAPGLRGGLPCLRGRVRGARAITWSTARSAPTPATPARASAASCLEGHRARLSGPLPALRTDVAAGRPLRGGPGARPAAATKRRPPVRVAVVVERETGFEPATSTLAR